MPGKLAMGQKELIRAKVMEQVVQKELLLKEAAVKLKVSYRQAKRIYRRYLEEGDEGFLHRNQGKASGRAYDVGIRKAAVAACGTTIGIEAAEDAIRYLREVYLPKINEKFAKAAAQPQDAHVPLTTPTSLEDILCYETPPVVSNDYVVSYKRRLLQIKRTARVLPKPRAQVTVRELLDGRIKLLYQNTQLEYVELEQLPHKEELATCSA